MCTFITLESLNHINTCCGMQSTHAYALSFMHGVYVSSLHFHGRIRVSIAPLGSRLHYMQVVFFALIATCLRSFSLFGARLKMHSLDVDVVSARIMSEWEVSGKHIKPWSSFHRHLSDFTLQFRTHGHRKLDLSQKGHKNI